VRIYIVVKNPNIERFKYENNTIMFYYYGTQIGIINSVPGGRIVAKETEFVSATLAVQPFPFIPASQNLDSFSDANSSMIIPIDFTVYVGGDAGVLYFFTYYVKYIVYFNFVIDIKQGKNLRMECS